MKLEAKSFTIEGLLKEDCFYVIPDYQRPYSWTKSQIEELFSDIEIAMETDSNHFFGTVMLNIAKKDKKVIEIIDGQQRMTTILMILYVILEEYNLQRFINQHNIETRKTKLKEKLAYTDDDGEIIEDKITLGDTNKEFFKSFIIDSYASGAAQKEKIIKDFKGDKRYKLNKPIIDAYQIIKSYFDAKILNERDTIAYQILKDFQNFILRSLEIVKIEVEDDADAFLIFETLNDRGLALSSVDLIKNKLFKNCANRADFNDIKNSWADIVNTLEDSNETKKYLRHFWMSKYNHVTAQNLFKVFREYVGNDYNKSKELIKELKQLSKYYSAINNPYNGIVSNKKLKKTLYDMGQLKFDLTHPILISAFRIFDNEEDIYIVAKLCTNFLIRYISIMKQKPSKIEKIICEIAQNLTVNKLIEEFNRLASDSVFKSSVETLSVSYQSYFTYYMLSEYEAYLHVNEPWKTTGRDEITVEHILPQTIKEENSYGQYWISRFGDKDNCKVFESRLGNLTLLGNDGQAKAGNKDFISKKEVYKEYTDMFSTKELLDYNEWNEDKLKERQTKMANAYIHIFSLDLNKI